MLVVGVNGAMCSEENISPYVSASFSIESTALKLQENTDFGKEDACISSKHEFGTAFDLHQTQRLF